MESCIRDEIVDHLVTNSLIKNKSCTTNHLQFLERLILEQDSGNPVDVVYLDFATYTMAGFNLTTTEAERDIGVKVQASLCPSLQCREAAQRANAVLGQITRAFHYRGRRTFIQLYKQYVRPHLEFAVPAWSPWTQGDIKTLEKIQQRAVRMVSGLRGATYEEKLKEIGMLSLKDLRIQYDLIQTLKII